MQKNSRVYVLDLVRFSAALAVVFYHYALRPDAENLGVFTSFAQFGYLGVPVFFTISGYVIAFSASGRDTKSFAIARAARLYPAYWVGLLFTSAWLVIYGIFDHSTIGILANIFMINDVFSLPSVDGVYWTLHAELRFYACIAILLLLGWFNLFKIWLPLWTGIVVLHSLTGQPGFLGWIISPTYSPYFIMGVVFYLLHTNGLNRWLVTVGAIASSLCLWRAWTTTESFIISPGWEDKAVALVIVLLNMLLFLGIVYNRIRMGKSHFVMALGALTFPLYLIHNQIGKLWLESLIEYVSEGQAIAIVTLIMVLLAWCISRFEPHAAKCFKIIVLSMVDRIELRLTQLLRKLTPNSKRSTKQA